MAQRGHRRGGRLGKWVAVKMIEVGLEPAGATVKHVVGKSRLSMQTREVFFLQQHNVCAKECMLHCEGKCAEDKVWIV